LIFDSNAIATAGGRGGHPRNRSRNILVNTAIYVYLSAFL